METKFSQNNPKVIKENPSGQGNIYNVRTCPECGHETIIGMPGGRDATCKNCGYKDPCCYD